MAKLSNVKRKISSFPKKKSLEGSTPGKRKNITTFVLVLTTILKAAVGGSEN